MRIKCPSCFAEFDLASALDSEAGRELMLRLAVMDATLSRPLTAYLGLFRSASRALSWDRALRLVDEALALDSDRQRLAQGLAKAVEVLREKQALPSWKPMSNHNYLCRVLEGLQPSGAPGQTAVVPADPPPRGARFSRPNSRTADAMLALQELKE